jgi:hypothetical protein
LELDLETDPTPHAATNQRPADHSLEEWAVEVRRGRIRDHHGSRSAEDDPVEVVVVHFSGGGYGLYRPNCQLVDATSLLDATRGVGELRERTAVDLEPSTVLLIRRGSDPDLIREEADCQLPQGARKLARSWQVPLREYAQRHGRPAVYAALKEAGCTKTQQTMRLWITDETIIGPKDDVDIDAMARATRSVTLTNRITDCKAAVHAVRAMHMSVADDVRARVLDGIEELVKSGSDLDDVVDLRDNYVLLTVEAVDPQKQLVPLSHANQVYDIDD